MDVSNILKNGLFQKISTNPRWIALEKSWLSSRIFKEGEAKKFIRGTPSKFSEANDSGVRGQIFLKENESLTSES